MHLVRYKMQYKTTFAWSRLHITGDGERTLCGYIVQKESESGPLIYDPGICKHCLTEFGVVAMEKYNDIQIELQTRDYLDSIHGVRPS